ncbi:MAG: hypothetical protein AB4058_21245 [Microcystaceae cyanobacterium]
MDITDSTKKLIAQVKTLKSKYTDLASLTFIDFYCQCREGCDYLFSPTVKQSVRILDILMWFFQCVEARSLIPLTALMWRDVMGPTLGEYQADEKTEKQIETVLASPQLRESVMSWDRQPSADGGVNLILRNLLEEIETIEAQQKAQKK